MFLYQAAQLNFFHFTAHERQKLSPPLSTVLRLSREIRHLPVQTGGSSDVALKRAAQPLVGVFENDQLIGVIRHKAKPFNKFHRSAEFGDVAGERAFVMAHEDFQSVLEIALDYTSRHERLMSHMRWKIQYVWREYKTTYRQLHRTVYRDLSPFREASLSIRPPGARY